MTDKKKEHVKKGESNDTTEKTSGPGSDTKQPKAEVKTQRKGGRIKRAFWYLVLALIIATIAWVVIEKPYQQLDLDFSSKSTETTPEQTPKFDTENELEQLASQLERTQNQVAAIERNQANIKDSKSQPVKQLEQQLSDLKNTLDQQGQQLSQLQRKMPEQQFEQISQWRLFEAKQTVSAAARLLWAAQDYPAALQLLQLADRQLAGIESATAIQIRQKLATDIGRVEALVDNQSDELVLAIAGLHQRLNDLPDRVAQKQFTDDGSEAKTLSTSADDWRTNLATNWDQFLDTFIRIQPSTQQPEPLLSESQRQAQTLRLDLLLTMAQHAALTGNDKVWRTNIDQALPLITELKGESKAVSDVYSRLEELRNATIDRAKVEQLEALDALAKAVAQGALQ